jgi:uncharacterized membrane protein YbaN (DUF454 family)
MSFFTHGGISLVVCVAQPLLAVRSFLLLVCMLCARNQQRHAAVRLCSAAPTMQYQRTTSAAAQTRTRAQPLLAVRSFLLLVCMLCARNQQRRAAVRLYSDVPTMQSERPTSAAAQTRTRAQPGVAVLREQMPGRFGTHQRRHADHGVPFKLQPLKPAGFQGNCHRGTGTQNMNLSRRNKELSRLGNALIWTRLLLLGAASAKGPQKTGGPNICCAMRRHEL